MTERQQRLHRAGAILVSGASVAGGIAGLACFLIVLTGEQRLILLFLAGALAMPMVLLVLATYNRRDRPAPDRSPSWLCAPLVVGAVLANGLIFVQPDAYLAVVFMAVSGLALMGVVRSTATAPRLGG